MSARVRVGKSRKVHIIRGRTVYSKRGYETTHCGFYGNPDHGWMVRTLDAASCKACLKADKSRTSVSG